MRVAFPTVDPANFGADRSGRPPAERPPRVDDKAPTTGVGDEAVRDWTYDPSQPPAPGRRGKPGKSELRAWAPHAF